MQPEDIKWIYKLVKVGERLFGRLPPFWAVLFLSGAIMIGFFALCGWLIGQFLSSEVATSPIAKGWPYLRDTKPYLMSLTVLIILGIFVYAWIKVIRNVTSTTPLQ